VARPTPDLVGPGGDYPGVILPAAARRRCRQHRNLKDRDVLRGENVEIIHKANEKFAEEGERT
jgi:hypothetical protein